VFNSEEKLHFSFLSDFAQGDKVVSGQWAGKEHLQRAEEPTGHLKLLSGSQHFIAWL
jgi:hypothetical protein